MNANSRWLIRIYPMTMLRARLLDRFTNKGIKFSRNSRKYLEIRADDFCQDKEQKRRLLDVAYGLLDDFPDSFIKLRYRE